MRVVIADDSVLLREGLSRLLAEAGVETCALAGDAAELAALVAVHRPDVAIIDIRMPPTYTHEGARAAAALRQQWPDLGILLLSQSLESRYAARLAQEHPQRFGYLLKDRVVDVGTLVDALRQVTQGGTILDPDVVAHLLGRRAARERTDLLSAREQAVLAVMAQGASNAAMARALNLSDKTIESHISSIFAKLALLPEPDAHRRVLAVLAWLGQESANRS